MSLCFFYHSQLNAFFSNVSKKLILWTTIEIGIIRWSWNIRNHHQGIWIEMIIKSTEVGPMSINMNSAERQIFLILLCCPFVPSLFSSVSSSVSVFPWPISNHYKIVHSIIAFQNAGMVKILEFHEATRIEECPLSNILF